MIIKSIPLLAISFMLVSSSLAATYNEGLQGDLSNDRLAPTPFTLDASSNVLSGSVISFPLDRDYFTVIVPEGFALSQIILTEYSSSNARAFIGVQGGATFTISAENPTTDGLLGYMHFGFDQTVPTDILDDLAQSLPPGFSAPLSAGAYSFWINQTENALTSYAFDFKTSVVPEPSAFVSLVGGLAGLFLLRRFGAVRR